VFGRAVIGSGGYGHDFSFADYPAVEVPRYSTDIAAAVDVLTWLRDRCGIVTITLHPTYVHVLAGRTDTPDTYGGKAETVPLAACRCALLVLAAMEGGR
jgi:hypothetical protein